MNPTEELIGAAGLAFLNPADRPVFARMVHRLRSARQALLFAECLPASRPALELVLALGLLPERRIQAIEPGAPGWGDFLGGSLDLSDAVVRIAGLDGDGFDETARALNLARDTCFRPGVRALVWVMAGGLERLPWLAPDLWRYRSAAHRLRTQPLALVPFPWPAHRGTS